MSKKPSKNLNPRNLWMIRKKGFIVYLIVYLAHLHIKLWMFWVAYQHRSSLLPFTSSTSTFVSCWSVKWELRKQTIGIYVGGIEKHGFERNRQGLVNERSQRRCWKKHQAVAVGLEWNLIGTTWIFCEYSSNRIKSKELHMTGMNVYLFHKRLRYFLPFAVCAVGQVQRLERF